jgi:hypothetical protein
MAVQLSLTNMKLKTHYAISKLMNSLRELSKLEYSLENYGECAKRAIQWLKLYVTMLPEYANEFNGIHGVSQNQNDKYIKQYFYTLNALSIENYDYILQKYMDCNKFLVGPTVYQLVQKVNSFMSKSNQWDVFMTFNDMVELDNGLAESSERNDKLAQCSKNLTKVKSFSIDELIPFQPILSKIHFRVKPIEKEVAIVAKPEQETEKYYEYDIVNTSNLYEDNEWTNITMQPLDTVIPKETNFKCKKSVENSGMRLTTDNAKIGQIISYKTKKSIEYGEITKIYPTYVDIARLTKNKDGSFVLHSKPMCKASGNKPAFTRVITLI